MTSSNTRQGHFQQADETERLEGAGSDDSRQEQHVTFTESISRTGVFQLAAAGEAHQHTRHLLPPRLRTTFPR
jgi:hypothetical protein